MDTSIDAVANSLGLTFVFLLLFQVLALGEPAFPSAKILPSFIRQMLVHVESCFSVKFETLSMSSTVISWLLQGLYMQMLLAV